MCVQINIAVFHIVYVHVFAQWKHVANVPYLYITYSGELFKPSALMIKIYISMYAMYKRFATARRRGCKHCTYRGSKSLTVARVWVDNIDLDGYNDFHHSQTFCTKLAWNVIFVASTLYAYIRVYVL